MSRIPRSLAAGVLVALLASVACGKYGPPRRIRPSEPTPPAQAQPAPRPDPADPAEDPERDRRSGEQALPETETPR